MEYSCDTCDYSGYAHREAECGAPNGCVNGSSYRPEGQAKTDAPAKPAVISEKLRERFCRDCRIPIRVFRDPYFMAHMRLLDPLYGSLKKYDLFLEELAPFKNEQDYFEYYRSVKEAAMQAIQESDGYQRFVMEDASLFTTDEKVRNLPSNDIYKETNMNKIMLSIDMRQANYSVLAHYDNDIFGTDSWKEFVGRFTESRHIINSKYIREVVLGNFNPKRQVAYEKHFMNLLLKAILAAVPELEDHIVFFSNDEVIFDVTGFTCGIAKKVAEAVIGFEDRHDKLRFRLEIFRVERIRTGYLKRFLAPGPAGSADPWICDGSYQLKKVEAVYMPMTVAECLGLPILEEYKVFMYNGKLAKFI